MNAPPQSQLGPHSSPSLRQPHALVAQQSPSLLGLQPQPSFGGRAVTVEVPLRERCAVDIAESATSKACSLGEGAPEKFGVLNRVHFWPHNFPSSNYTHSGGPVPISKACW